MSKEELVYRLTRLVYDRLGPQTDARLVEDLVTELFRTIGSARVAEDRSNGQSARVVVSALGTSRPGIVAAITSTLAESRYDIVDMNQTVVQGKFAMVLIAEAADNALDLSSLRAGLTQVGDRVGVQVYSQREDLFQSMHRV